MAKHKSKHFSFVDAWCLENEILPEDLDDDHVLRAQIAFQRVVRLIPGKERFNVKCTQSFNKWCWRSMTIQHFIGQEDKFQLFMLLMLHEKYDFMVTSCLLSPLKWSTLDDDIKSAGEEIYVTFYDRLARHIEGMANGTADLIEFPLESTYLETFLASTFYAIGSPTDELSEIIKVDHSGVIRNYPALFTSALLLNIYCHNQERGREDESIIECCKRTTDSLLREQPGPYTESFGKITPVCI